MVTDSELVVVFAVMGTLVTIFIGLPWLILNFIIQWRRASQLKAGDEHMLEDVWRATRAMEHRIDALERNLDAQSSGARQRMGADD